MKAIVLNEFGTADNLVLTEIPTPTIKEGEVLVQVKAFSINPVDIKTRNGKSLAKELSQYEHVILGWDISGVVTASKSEQFKEGDEVFGMVNFPGNGSAYAEFVASPAAHLALKPKNISHAEAAAATLAALTAWQALVTNAKVQQGQKILIHAASGGVGHYAVQIAKHLGAYVIGTSSAANKDLVLSLGADEHFDYTSQRFEDVYSDVDFVLEAIGGEHGLRSLEIIKKGGTMITLPSIAGDNKEAGAAKGINAYFFMVTSNGRDMKDLAILLEQGKVRSVLSNVYTADQIKQAHAEVESARAKGKVVVTLE